MRDCQQEFDEGQSCFRTMINQELTITLFDDENNLEVSANCRDLSDTGVALEINHPVDVGTLIKIHLDCDDQISLPLTHCLGRVQRCTIESDELFLLTVEILDCE